MRPPFRFKKFTISDRLSAMKLNTDGVLLGAWVQLDRAKNLLDIGTGCGIIALMMAQRSDGIIHAVELHKDSALEAKENFRVSPWSSRLHVLQSDITDFNPDGKFDVIVSNPPFFENDKKSPFESRNISKHNDHLSCDQLIHSVNRLLNSRGRFSVILPYDNFEVFHIAVTTSGFLLCRKCSVYPKPDKYPNRVLIEYSKLAVPSTVSNSIVIRNSDNSFTKEYIELTKDFYLNF